MKTYQLTETIGADMEPRFHIDGRRVSREAYSTLREKAHRDGKMDCFLTKGRQLPGGRIRRTNYSWATVHEPSR